MITGLLAERCASVAVVDERDENLVVNQKMNEAHTNISYMKAADFQKMEAVEKEGKYDLVVLRADRPDMDIKECFTRLSSYLSENGKLIFACENALGLNFLSGAVHDEDETAFTKGELEEALKEAGLSKVEFYYPMPEYKRAVSVYSDRYLPGKGDIPHVTAVYDRQRWACIHEDEISDKLVQEKAFGLFSNAYLAVASKGAESFKTVFAKYNSTRKEEFQIRTAILEENGKRYVEKTPLTEKAAGHISSMSEKYEKLSKVNSGVKVLAPVYSEDKKAVRFEFLKGRTLAEILGEQIRGKKAPVEALKAAIDQVFGQAVLKNEPFAPTDPFKEVFGDSEDVLSLQDTSYEVSNIDGLFENLMETEDGLYCMDYEWVFDFPIPSGFVRYRNLVYFYYKYEGLMEYENATQFLKEFGMDEKLAETYASMEVAFQTWVHGDGTQGYLGNYKQRLVTLEAVSYTHLTLPTN